MILGAPIGLPGCYYTNCRHGCAWNISVRRKSTNKLLNVVDLVVYFGKTNDKSSSVGKDVFLILL
jgi:hypothetical protein